MKHTLTENIAYPNFKGTFRELATDFINNFPLMPVIKKKKGKKRPDNYVFTRKKTCGG